MNEELLKPSLTYKESNKDLISVNINIMFAMPLLCGFVPTFWMVLKNARWLKLEYHQIFRIKLIGISVILIEYLTIGFLWRFISSEIAINVGLWFRFIGFGVYFYFYSIMKNNYGVLKLFGGKMVFILHIIIIWTFLGLEVEFLLSALTYLLFGVFK